MRRLIALVGLLALVLVSSPTTTTAQVAYPGTTLCSCDDLFNYWQDVAYMLTGEYDLELAEWLQWAYCHSIFLHPPTLEQCLAAGGGTTCSTL